MLFEIGLVKTLIINKTYSCFFNYCELMLANLREILLSLFLKEKIAE